MLWSDGWLFYLRGVFDYTILQCFRHIGWENYGNAAAANGIGKLLTDVIP